MNDIITPLHLLLRIRPPFYSLRAKINGKSIAFNGSHQNMI